MEDHVKGGTSQEKTIVQKKPVRPILPAYSNKSKNAHTFVVLNQAVTKHLVHVHMFMSRKCCVQDRS